MMPYFIVGFSPTAQFSMSLFVRSVSLIQWIETVVKEEEDVINHNVTLFITRVNMYL